MLVGTILLMIFSTVDGDRWLKNLIGRHLANSVDCPNCRDNLWWKDYGSLDYSEGKGITICKECLATPIKLDEEKIVQNLSSLHGSMLNDIELIRQAIIRYKENSPNNVDPVDEFFNKYLNDFKNIEWKSVKPYNKGGWLEEYGANTKFIYINIALGETITKHKKTAIDIVFKRESPPHYYYQYFENGKLKYSHGDNNIIASKMIHHRLAGVFCDSLPFHVWKELLNTIYY